MASRNKHSKSRRKHSKRIIAACGSFLQACQAKLKLRLNTWQKVLVIFGLVIALVFSAMYGVAKWYISKHSREPLVYGVTFIPDYARYFDIDPQKALKAIIDDLGVRRFRFVSYWNNIEKEPGIYDFSELDWQFAMAEQAGAEVSLSIGLRQPRWPECHWPAWAKKLPKEEWRHKLKDQMKTTIDRYKNRAALTSYQLENEYFLEVFGVCPDHDRERLVDEFNFVKSLDGTRPILVTRSNNATPSWPLGAPRGDIVGASIYKRVYDKTITKRYFEYPYPAWFYGFLAGATELTTSRNTIIHELQAEPWPRIPIQDASLAEQDMSMTPEILRERLKYGKDTGMRTIDLWGAEWWYWRKTTFGDSSLWNVVQEEIRQTNLENSKLKR